MGETCLGELRSVSKDFIHESIDTTPNTTPNQTERLPFVVNRYLRLLSRGCGVLFLVSPGVQEFFTMYCCCEMICMKD